jgi:DNA topoisomerase-2
VRLCGYVSLQLTFVLWHQLYITPYFSGLQVSFVNGIATTKGGTHVDYVANQIATRVMDILNKKDKNAKMKLHTVKSHLWVFVNALIENPAFDSQTKETLTTHQGSFESNCVLSADFLNKGM